MLINQDTIIKDSDPIVREKSQDVLLPLSKEDEELIKGLYTYVKNSTDEELAEKENLRPAVGISAIQVGVKKKICVIICTDHDKNDEEVHYEYALVNPRIVSSSVQKSYLANGEGCLSVLDDHQGHVIRSARIKVQAYDYLTKKDVLIKAHGYFAIVLQHEIDHFSGILFYDRIDAKNPNQEIEGAIVI